MAANGSAQLTFKNAIGAVKDSTKVGLVKGNGDNKKLDIAIVKATKRNEKFPKEKHVKTIFNAVSCSNPRPVVVFCLHAMAKRLSKTHNWTVALKTLIVIHRALREVDPTFLDELINFSRHRSLSMLNLAHLRDDSSTNAWDYSAWVRVYALYLEERLACFSALKYDVEREQS
ncbi:hypothetical protein SLEP1_g28565 [Rubroshorea leprosula]|uniref:ENTH domain-containing protein n=1 Tax=Rubroshorea leprosula TaxID=152421 RepID=A0AAV5JU22_9ROSI|nr:hypothetical protein SLEP1_g28565 [Rubroshorea leprosula]